MTSSRLEAFSDGVIAILITIMVLELRTPLGAGLSALKPLTPVLLSYIVSFVYLGIYWNNHHHLLQAVEKVNGSVLWANLFLLFWLSLVPFVTAWVGQNTGASWPAALYGVVLFLAAVAYYILERALIAANGEESHLAAALGDDLKGRVSLAVYFAGIPLAFLSAWISYVLYVLVAIIWLIPDRRIEEELKGE